MVVSLSLKRSLHAGSPGACPVALAAGCVAPKPLELVPWSPILPRAQVGVLKRLFAHPTIISLLDVFDDPESLQLVFEICSGGELFERIVNQGCYEESEAAYVATQLIEGILHCHRSGVAHRDLKPENILLKSQDSSEIRIADFGLACLRTETELMHTVW